MTATATTDAITDQQRFVWDAVSPGWQLWSREFERGAATVTARLLELAGAAPGQRVLDVGSGIGEPALSARRAVAPDGHVVGVDLSPAMVAAARAAADGVQNVDFVVGDVATAALPPRSFDVALSRWGLMFAADRVELLREVARLLKPGGVLAAAVWGDPQRVPMISLAFRVISSHLELDPPPPGPGPFTMSDPGATTAELEQAGFDEVEIHEQTVPFRLDSRHDFARFARDVLPPGMKRALEERCGSVDDPEVWAAFDAAARAYDTPDGAVSLPSACMCIRAVARGTGGHGLRARASNGRTVRLDGAVATELERHGVPVTAPWWTSRALLTEEKRRVLRSVHAGYVAAGAQLITANTFRCNQRALRDAGVDRAGYAWMVHAAVAVARATLDEAGGNGTRIAGSMAPVEDCYRPDLVPSDEELRAEHRWLATEMLRAGVDLVLIETMNTVREASIALEQVVAAGGRAWVSFVCTDGARLLSGEPVADAARAVEAGGAEAVLVNCTQLATTEECLRRLADVCRGPIGAYPNVEHRPPDPGDGPPPAAVGPEEFADTLGRWHDELGAALLGGCCGTGPAHIAALRDRLGDDA